MDVEKKMCISCEADAHFFMTYEITTKYSKLNFRAMAPAQRG